MKKLLVLATLVISAGLAYADNIEKIYLPDHHWAYSSLTQLGRWEMVDKDAVSKPLTREDVGIILMKMYNAERSWKKPANLDSRSANDIILALRREFADEMARSSIPFDKGENTLESRITGPPRLTIAPEVLARIDYKSYVAKETEKKLESTKKEVEKTKAAENKKF